MKTRQGEDNGSEADDVIISLLHGDHMQGLSPVRVPAFGSGHDKTLLDLWMKKKKAAFCPGHKQTHLAVGLLRIAGLLMEKPAFWQ